MSPLRCQPLLILITTSSELLFHHVPLCLMSDSSPRLWTVPNDFGRFRPFPTFVRIISFRCSTLLFGFRPFRPISATSVCLLFSDILSYHLGPMSNISVRSQTLPSNFRNFHRIQQNECEQSQSSSSWLFFYYYLFVQTRKVARMDTTN